MQFLDTLGEYVDPMAILAIALVFLPVERLIPLRREQKILRKDFFTDLVYLLFNRIPIQMGTVFIIGTGLAALRTLVPEGVGETVRLQPLWLQTAEVILLADIGFYLAHRLFHAVPVLWRFHAVHHSIEELDWLAAHRVHPVDQIFSTVSSMLPVFLLGFSEAAVIIYALVYQWHSLLIHANVRLDFGPLKWVIASPQFHHWHHANQREAFDKNFAGQLAFLDRLLGTMFLPRDTRHPDVYGTDEPVPRHYPGQLLFPFTRPQPAPAAAEAQTAETQTKDVP